MPINWAWILLYLRTSICIDCKIRRTSKYVGIYRSINHNPLIRIWLISFSRNSWHKWASIRPWPFLFFVNVVPVHTHKTVHLEATGNMIVWVLIRNDVRVQNSWKITLKDYTYLDFSGPNFIKPTSKALLTTIVSITNIRNYVNINIDIRSHDLMMYEQYENMPILSMCSLVEARENQYRTSTSAYLF
jgi:hypothetical protein